MSCWTSWETRTGRFFFDDLDIIGEESQHALLVESSEEGSHRIGVRLRLFGALYRCALFKEDQRTNEFIAPLHLIRDTRL